MTVKEAAQALEAALKTVSELRVHMRPPTEIAPPVGLVDAPTLGFEAYCAEPTRATFPVYVLVEPSDRTFEELWELIPSVTTAIEEEVAQAVIVSAEPIEWMEHPGYRIQVEVGL